MYTHSHIYYTKVMMHKQLNGREVPYTTEIYIFLQCVHCLKGTK